MKVTNWQKYVGTYKHNIQRGNVSFMVSYPWTMAPKNQSRLDKTPVPRRAYIYSYACMSMYLRLEEIYRCCGCFSSQNDRNCSLCFYSDNDVLQLAQRNVGITIFVRSSCACFMRPPFQGTKPYQAYYLSVCCVLRTHVQFCRFDKADATAGVQRYCKHRPPL